MNSKHHFTLAVALLVLAAAPAAHAQTTYYSTNTTITSPVIGDAVVGNSAPGAASPTVTQAAGGSISHDVRVYNNSVFNMNANVGGSLSAYDASTVTIRNGTLSYALFADNNSIVNIAGGTFNNVINAFNNSTLRISGGTFGANALFAYDNSTLDFIGDASSLGYTLVNPSYGYLGGYSQYALRGTLADNTSLANTFLYVQNNGGSGSINTRLMFNDAASVTGGPTVTPEPGSIALLIGLSVTGAGLLLRRRK